jgi:3-deoxy-D-manno-octulosonic-acid transferase
MIWERLKGKKHPAFLQRLGFFLPQMKSTIWIHAVSVGEVKAAVPLIALLKEQFLDHQFCITTTTATGFQEASNIPADFHLYAPLDFSFSAHQFVKKIDPKFLFLIEGDVWPNQIKAVKKNGGKAILVSGKISKRSLKRCLLFPKISQRLYSDLDLICAQTEEYAKCFKLITLQPVQVTGNLKFDITPNPISSDAREYLTISCTHEGEEEAILDAIKNIDIPLFIAPRHPERFHEVASLLKQKGISFTLYSQKKEGKVVLVDAMGQLPYCYAKSKLAIIGGSFIEGIGGHNFLEPGLYGCPMIFGPHSEKQKETVSLILESHSGLQVPLYQLEIAAREILSSRNEYIERFSKMHRKIQGASQATWEVVLANMNR